MNPGSDLRSYPPPLRSLASRKASFIMPRREPRRCGRPASLADDPVRLRRAQLKASNSDSKPCHQRGPVKPQGSSALGSETEGARDLPALVGFFRTRVATPRPPHPSKAPTRERAPVPPSRASAGGTASSAGRGGRGSCRGGACGGGESSRSPRREPRSELLPEFLGDRDLLRLGRGP